MPRKSKVITFSMPLEMAEQVQQVVEEGGRTMSEILRDAIRLYLEEREWLRRVEAGKRFPTLAPDPPLTSRGVSGIYCVPQMFELVVAFYWVSAPLRPVDGPLYDGVWQ